MFDTVASLAKMGALLILAVSAIAVVAGLSWLLWLTYPSFTPLFGDTVGGGLSWLFGAAGLDVSSWLNWFYFTAAAALLVMLLWYVIEQERFAVPAILGISYERGPALR